MKSNRIASIIIKSNRIVRSVNRSGPTVDVCWITCIEIENNCKIAISSQCVRKFH